MRETTRPRETTAPPDPQCRCGIVKPDASFRRKKIIVLQEAIGIFFG